MITLQDFIDLSMDGFYKINVFYTNGGTEIIHQKEVGEIAEQLEADGLADLLGCEVVSWDIEETTKEFCVNIG